MAFHHLIISFKNLTGAHFFQKYHPLILQPTFRTLLEFLRSYFSKLIYLSSGLDLL